MPPYRVVLSAVVGLKCAALPVFFESEFPGNVNSKVSAEPGLRPYILSIQEYIE